jgi:formylglycine-generating enzyme required for sulfatase activity
MAVIPGVSKLFKIQYRVRECGLYESSPDAPGQGTAPSLHQLAWTERQACLQKFAVDLAPVTNGDYARFLKSAKYRPRHAERFLAHWVEGRLPPGLEDHPVVYVDLEDARAYARWAGKRLLTEEEWQWAAQGPVESSYPWGNEMLPGRCNDGSGSTSTTSVLAFPDGRSPWGLYDMCGNVWEWTESERSDGRTRFAMLRGGSFYRPGGSDWYFDAGPKPTSFTAKMLLLWSGLDRCANIGFRCAASL